MKVDFTKKAVGSAILLSFIALAPMFASAETERDVRVSNINSYNGRSCWRAIGHMFAPGWIKHNGYYSISYDCRFNRGNGNGNATTTPDTTAPVISNITVDARVKGAVIKWTTNERANSGVFYSTNSNIDTANILTTPFSGNGSMVLNHTVTLERLSPNTTYYIIVRSFDPAGNVTVSNKLSFTTKAGPNTTDTTAPVISGLSNTVGTTNIQTVWTTDEAATSRVYYSTTPGINVASASYVENTSLSLSHTVNITGLAAATRYYLVAESKDAAGNISRSSEFSTTTSAVVPAPDTTAPVISSVAITTASTSVNIAWHTNENSTSKIWYGTTNPLVISSTTPFVSSTALVGDHALSISGLSTSTPYYFVIESKDAAGNTATSSQYTFTTSAN